MISLLAERDRIGLPAGKLLLDGEWRDPSGEERWSHVHPASAEHLGEFGVATVEDVDHAVAAARRAVDDGPWSKMPARERQRLLQRVAQLVDEHQDELNRMQTLDNGIPISFVNNIYEVSAEIVRDIFDHQAGWADRIHGETLPPYRDASLQGMTVREPVGVVAAVIPWNAPLMLFAQKVAPALAAGCSVVLKPSEFATFSALRLAELVVEAGVPAGVLNIVTGPGSTVGEALVTHPQVDLVTFTGSRAVGQHIREVTARGLKRVTLELGGKSPNLIFEDANVDLAAAQGIGMVSLGLSGQGCVCLTRFLVHESIYDEFVEKSAALRTMAVAGDPFDPAVNAGPIINERQLERVLGFIEKGEAEGARLACGGGRIGGDLAQGYFVEPTIFADVDNAMTIAQEEIFGPVLAVIPFRDEAEAIRIANDSDYGLGAAVMTRDGARGMRVAHALKAGTVGVNHHVTVVPSLPFGGYKLSGLGREGGSAGIEEFTTVKTVLVHVPPAG